MITLACPGGLAELTGAGPSGQDSRGVDGESARGSRHKQAPAAHLPSAMTGSGQVVGRLRVPDRPNEITCFCWGPTT